MPGLIVGRAKFARITEITRWRPSYAYRWQPSELEHLWEGVRLSSDTLQCLCRVDPNLKLSDTGGVRNLSGDKNALPAHGRVSTAVESSHTNHQACPRGTAVQVHSIPEIHELMQEFLHA